MRMIIEGQARDIGLKIQLLTRAYCDEHPEKLPSKILVADLIEWLESKKADGEYFK